MIISWDEKWNIGHNEIDAQHRLWIGFFNKLHEALLSSNFEALDEVRKKTVDDLISYTEYHFDKEEAVMRQHSYPDAPRHWRLHKNFKNLLLEKLRSGESGFVLNTEILSLIKDWLLEHIQLEDQKLGEFLRLQSSAP